MVASRKRRTEEHRLLIASSRIRKDFVKACSKISPSASNVFWAGGGIATFPFPERTNRSLCKTFQARNRLIRVKGKWVYLYRAVDSSGATIDFLLSAKRDAAATEHFLAKALSGDDVTNSD
jgi:hypothetical protein